MRLLETEVNSADYIRWRDKLTDIFELIKCDNYCAASFECGRMASMFFAKAEILQEKEKTLN